VGGELEAESPDDAEERREAGIAGRGKRAISPRAAAMREGSPSSKAASR
jgi:hypothetical protein